ncbi:hypothetical protein A2110_02255 [Candidatus Jorgensenbacteria bacterium GWA1_54_12]|uniref:5'-3' exonuclease domain-containing protein n=1 Tax=Candidatus Jorgensenbacteria bacterium GWA1_54_12 TaxID=1798468 RepID=A0A1F6BK88_9BACT|nr:MAG: hypothetical protein A2110_02255 [Candidatus Jorgensenbacteria bacterium GWA1_54_12]
MRKALLIDAHALIHRTYHALPPLTAPDGSPTGALYGLAGMLLKILGAMKPDYVVAAFDRPEKTFREDLFTDYKAQRPEAPNDLIAQFKEARVLCTTMGISVVEMPGVEADDVLGTLAERFHSEGAEVVILTGDMDALQLVDDARSIRVLGLKRGVSETQEYREADVREKYGVEPRELPDYKGFAGDASDNIRGVRGVGPKGAQRLIKTYGTLEGVYEHLFDLAEKEREKLTAGREDAFLSRKLNTISRDIPLVANVSEMRFHPDWAAARHYFEARGFTSIVRRLPAE